jgi:hypothetical protein
MGGANGQAADFREPSNDHFLQYHQASTTVSRCYDSEAALFNEKAVLACLLQQPSLLSDADLSVDDFLLTDHREIWSAICALREDGVGIDAFNVVDRLQGKVAPYHISVLASDDRPSFINFRSYVQNVRNARRERDFIALFESLGSADPAQRPMVLDQISDLLKNDPAHNIRFEDIPDIFGLNIKPLEVLVPRIVARKCLTLIAGDDGVAKSLLAMKLAVAVATGGTFLGEQCIKAPVLYIDYENPDGVVLDRMRLVAGGPVPKLKIWGTWLGPPLGPPPLVGTDAANALLRLAEEVKPLFVFDALRDAHEAKENDSDEMSHIMKFLRRLSTAGAAVLILHHIAQRDGSTGRGSNSIRAACDVRFVQTMNEEDPSLLTLKCGKTRFGARFNISIRADYEKGTFEASDNPEFRKKQEENIHRFLRAYRIMEKEPGLSQTDVCKKLGGRKKYARQTIKIGEKKRYWESRATGQAAAYFCLKEPVPEDT